MRQLVFSAALDAAGIGMVGSAIHLAVALRRGALVGSRTGNQFAYSFSLGAGVLPFQLQDSGGTDSLVPGGAFTALYKIGRESPLVGTGMEGFEAFHCCTAYVLGGR